jgi:hypothetical protein
MKIDKATAASRKTNEARRSIVASIEFAVRASLHEEYVDADFVHSILGKISAKSEDRGDEEDVGYIKASLVQFGEAMDHGISTERLGDGIDGNIAEYWELLFDLDRRLRGGVSFTLSHAIDDGSDFFDTAGEYALPAWTNEKGERGNAAFDVRLRTSAFWSWELPGVRKTRLLSGWILSGIAVSQSGQPFTVNSAVDLNQDGNATDRPLTSSGLELHPNGYPRRVQVIVTEPLSQWAYPTGGNPEQSSIGRNTIRSEGFTNLDVRMQRTFHLAEHSHWTLYCDAINLFNHANFGIPVRILEAPEFGTSTKTIGPPRSIQFGLKIER